MCCALASGGAAAADGDPGWELSLAPYLWATSLGGTLDAGPLDTDVDVDFADIVDALDAGFLVAFEARRDRLHLGANAIYLRLSGDAERAVGGVLPPAPGGSMEIGFELDTALLETYVGYDVFRAPLFGSERPFALEARLGARTWYVAEDVDVTIRPGLPFGPFHRTFDDSQDWIDALVGARIRAPLGRRLGVVVAGDYGGFGWGSSADPTWAVQGFATFALGEHWGLAAGWRHLELDRGALELRMSGPLLGAVYRF
jgi:hypothetical protein